MKIFYSFFIKILPSKHLRQIPLWGNKTVPFTVLFSGVYRNTPTKKDWRNSYGKYHQYFGTYKPAADGAVASFKFEYLCTLGFAAIVIFLGRAIVARSEALRKYAIPAPVISGLIFSIIVSCIKGAGIVGISFDATIMKDLCQNLFFLCVGFGFSAKMLKHAGGKLCILIAFAACLLITCQDLLGYALSQLIGMHPLLALQCSSAAMSGGVGTASAFGPIFEEWGAPDATVVGVAAGTMGNIMGSLIGGPVAAFLIAKHGLSLIRTTNRKHMQPEEFRSLTTRK